MDTTNNKTHNKTLWAFDHISDEQLDCEDRYQTREDAIDAAESFLTENEWEGPHQVCIYSYQETDEDPVISQKEKVELDIEISYEPSPYKEHNIHSHTLLGITA